MSLHSGKYVVDEKGKRIEVILDIAAYETILDELEDLESVRAYDAAKAADDEVVPIEQAFQEIEQSRD